MKKAIILAALFFGTFLNFEISAQPMQYSYDDAGNRIKKEIDLNPGQLRKKSPLSDQISGQTLKIYPNPTTETIKVEVDSLSNQSTTIALYDINGRLVLEQAALSLVNEVDLSQFANGKYILRFRNGEEISNWVIIKN
jgi:hypothetical protein